MQTFIKSPQISPRYELTRKQLRELAKKKGIRRGRNTQDTVENLKEAGIMPTKNYYNSIMNNLISETIQSIAEFKDLQKKLKEDCKKICADETISIQDRWELFKNAPDKEHSSYDETPPSQLVGLEKEITPYDDWYLERRETFNVVKRIEYWEANKKYNSEVLDKFKNYYMVRYIGSWIYDW